MPAAALVRLILGGGAEVDVGGTDPDVGGAVKLDPLGDGEVDFENHLGPGSGTSGGRGVGEASGIEVVEFELLIELDFAGCGVRTLHGRNGGGGITGTDLELRDGYGG